jgi:hypothetical protein
MRTRGRVTALALLIAAAELPAFEMDFGAGITIDAAPFGIESVEPLVIVAPWIGPRDRMQAGLIVAGSFGPDTSDIALALCARVWPGRNSVALYGGAGVLAAPGQDPSVMPYLLGGLRFEVWHIGFILPGLAVRFEPTGSDTEIWIGVLYRL